MVRPLGNALQSPLPSGRGSTEKSGERARWAPRKNDSRGRAEPFPLTCPTTRRDDGIVQLSRGDLGELAVDVVQTPDLSGDLDNRQGGTASASPLDVRPEAVASCEAGLRETLQGRYHGFECTIQSGEGLRALDHVFTH